MANYHSSLDLGFFATAPVLRADPIPRRAIDNENNKKTDIPPLADRLCSGERILFVDAMEFERLKFMWQQRGNGEWWFGPSEKVARRIIKQAKQEKQKMRIRDKNYTCNYSPTRKGFSSKNKNKQRRQNERSAERSAARKKANLNTKKLQVYAFDSKLYTHILLGEHFQEWLKRDIYSRSYFCKDG
jgi:hypothetical protein